MNSLFSFSNILDLKRNLSLKQIFLAMLLVFSLVMFSQAQADTKYDILFHMSDVFVTFDKNEASNLGYIYGANTTYSADVTTPQNIYFLNEMNDENIVSALIKFNYDMFENNNVYNPKKKSAYGNCTSLQDPTKTNYISSGLAFDILTGTYATSIYYPYSIFNMTKVISNKLYTPINDYSKCEILIGTLPQNVAFFGNKQILTCYLNDMNYMYSQSPLNNTNFEDINKMSDIFPYTKSCRILDYFVRYTVKGFSTIAVKEDTNAKATKSHYFEITYKNSTDDYYAQIFAYPDTLFNLEIILPYRTYNAGCLSKDHLGIMINDASNPSNNTFITTNFELKTADQSSTIYMDHKSHNITIYDVKGRTLNSLKNIVIGIHNVILPTDNFGYFNFDFKIRSQAFSNRIVQTSPLLAVKFPAAINSEITDFIFTPEVDNVNYYTKVSLKLFYKDFLRNNSILVLRFSITNNNINNYDFTQLTSVSYENEIVSTLFPGTPNLKELKFWFHIEDPNYYTVIIHLNNQYIPPATTGQANSISLVLNKIRLPIKKDITTTFQANFRYIDVTDEYQYYVLKKSVSHVSKMAEFKELAFVRDSLYTGITTSSNLRADFTIPETTESDYLLIKISDDVNSHVYLNYESNKSVSNCASIFSNSTDTGIFSSCIMNYNEMNQIKVNLPKLSLGGIKLITEFINPKINTLNTKLVVSLYHNDDVFETRSVSLNFNTCDGYITENDECKTCPETFIVNESKRGCICNENSILLNDSCFTCPVNSIKVGTSCSCQNNYSNSTDSNGVFICVCDKGIIDSQTGNCSLCSNNMIPVNNVCGCPSDMIFSDDSNCNACPSLSVPSSDQKSCECQNGYSLNVTNNKCECLGYIDSNDSICKLCTNDMIVNSTNTGCTCGDNKKIINGTSCENCPSLSIVSNDKLSCICQNGYTLNTKSNKCECLNYIDSSDKICKQCLNNMIVNSDKSGCTCPSNKIIISAESSCDECPALAIPSTNQLSCECQNGYLLNSESNRCECSGYIDSSDNNKCKQCLNGMIVNSNKSGCTCESTQIISNDSCIECPKHSIPSSNKLTCECQNGYSLNTSSNSCECIGYIDSGDSFCKTCPNNMIVNDKKDGCTCEENKKIISNKCVSCPDLSISNSDKSACLCQFNYSLDSENNKCVCNNGYVDSETKNCIVCSNNMIPVNNVCGCPSDMIFLDDSKCKVCPSLSVPSSDQKSCECQNGYSLNTSNNVCECLGYINSQTSACELCSNNMIVNSTKTGCTCNTNQTIIDNSSCKNCPTGSINSEDQLSCICQDGFTINTNQNECICTGYIDSADSDCKQCSNNMIVNSTFSGCTCSSTQKIINNDECVTCPSKSAPSLDKLSCVCLNNFTLNSETNLCECLGYVDSNDNNCKQCQNNTILNSAKSGCTCESGSILSNNNTQCSVCPENSIPNSDKTICNCINNYSYDDESKSCICENGLIQNSVCNKCPNNQVLSEDKTKCICPENNYISLGYCYSCPENSIVRSDLSTCDCINGFLKTLSNNGNVQCVCEGNMIISKTTDSENKTITKCLLCENNMIANELNTECLCNSNQINVKDSNNNDCITCPLNSSPNEDKSLCICTGNYSMNSEKTECLCNNGYSNYIPTSNSYECVICQNNQIVVVSSTGISKCSCQEGHYLDNTNTCIAVPINSRTNYNKTDFICNENFERVDGECICSSSVNYQKYFDSKTNSCVLCPYNLVVSDTKDSCICTSDLIYKAISENNNKYYCSICPGSSVPSKDQLSCECKNNFSFVNNNCVCENGYVSQGICTTCNNNLIVNHDKNGCTCEENKYLDSNTNTCISCPLNSSPLEDLSACSCNKNFTLDNNSTEKDCICQGILSSDTTECALCPSNMIVDKANNSCTCPDNFILSSTNWECVECFENSSPNSGKTSCDCVNGYQNNNYYSTLPKCFCEGGLVSVNPSTNIEECSCPNGYYDSHNVCHQCGNLLLNRENKKCYCPFNNIISNNEDNTKSCVSCPENSKAINNKCSCLDNFIANNTANGLNCTCYGNFSPAINESAYSSCNCDNGFINEKNICQLCNSDTILNISNNDCVCLDNSRIIKTESSDFSVTGIYNYSCDSCGENSKINTETNVCDCINNFYLKDNKCFCPEENITSNGICVQCLNGYLDSEASCVKCPNNSIADTINKTCVCSGNKYFSKEQMKCIDCPMYSAITSTNVCSCINGFINTNQTSDSNINDLTCYCSGEIDNNKCNCSNGYFTDNGTICHLCDYTKGFISDDILKSCICKAGLVLNAETNSCQECGSYSSANKEQTDCVCNTGFSLNNDNKTCECHGAIDTLTKQCLCPNGFFSNNNTKCNECPEKSVFYNKNNNTYLSIQNNCVCLNSYSLKINEQDSSLSSCNCNGSIEDITGNCVCINGYFNDKGDCISCHSEDSMGIAVYDKKAEGKCSCPNNFYYDNETTDCLCSGSLDVIDKELFCNCNNGFFSPDNKNCYSCPSHSSIMNNINNTSNSVNNITQICSCNSNFSSVYNSDTGLLDSCSCSGEFDPKTQTCECPNGYFSYSSDNNTIKCITCSDTNAIFDDVNKRCFCKNEFYEIIGNDTENYIDIQCQCTGTLVSKSTSSPVYECECINGIFTSNNSQCIICPDNSLFDKKNNSCICISGYQYDSENNKCVNCNENIGFCEDCKENMIFDSISSQCICNSNFYFNSFSKTCECDGEIDYLGNCICENGYFDYSNICVQCDKNTSQYNGYDCVCYNGYRDSYKKNNNGLTLCECKGQIDDDLSCKCSLGVYDDTDGSCLFCENLTEINYTNANNCSCNKNNSIKELNLSVNLDDSNNYEYKLVDVDCNYCPINSTSNISQTKCICNKGYIPVYNSKDELVECECNGTLKDNTCYCLNGYFNNNNECIECINKNISELNSQGECSCKFPYTGEYPNCNCDGDIINNYCVCTGGVFDTNGKCNKCGDNYYVYDNKCVCPQYYSIVNGNCVSDYCVDGVIEVINSSSSNSTGSDSNETPELECHHCGINSAKLSLYDSSTSKIINECSCGENAYYDSIKYECSCLSGFTKTIDLESPYEFKCTCDNGFTINNNNNNNSKNELICITCPDGSYFNKSSQECVCGKNLIKTYSNNKINGLRLNNDFTCDCLFDGQLSINSLTKRNECLCLKGRIVDTNICLELPEYSIYDNNLIKQIMTTYKIRDYSSFKKENFIRCYGNRSYDPEDNECKCKGTEISINNEATSNSNNRLLQAQIDNNYANNNINNYTTPIKIIRLLEATNTYSSCECINGYFDENYNCVKCGENQTYDSKTETCLCKNNFLNIQNKCVCEEVNAEIIDDMCVCKNGYLDYNKNKCIKCPENSYYSKEEKICICLNNFSFNKDTYSCDTCSGVSVSSSLYNNNETEDYCACNNGYFKNVNDIYENNSATLSVQSSSCYVCGGNSVYDSTSGKCTCRNGFNYEVNTNDCVCANNKLIVDILLNDGKVEKICSCSNNSGDSENNDCLFCPEFSVYNSSKKQCLCLENFTYNSDSNTCECNYSQDSSLFPRCSAHNSCKNGFLDKVTGECIVCPVLTEYNSATNECIGINNFKFNKETNVLSCNGGNIINNNCVCYNGYFNEEKLCISCGLNEQYNDKTNSCDCKNNYFKSIIENENTNYQSQSCSCLAPAVEINNECTCLNGYFTSNYKCVQCPSNSIYSSEQRECICISNFTKHKINDNSNSNSGEFNFSCDCNGTLIDNQCLCPNGSFNNKNECVICPLYSIFNKQNNKCECVNNFKKNPKTGECDICDGAEIKELSYCSCIGYFDNNNDCTQCPENSHYIGGIIKNDNSNNSSNCACNEGYSKNFYNSNFNNSFSCVKCPEKSFNVSNGKCSCISGYEMNETNTECVGLSTPLCNYNDEIVFNNQCYHCSSQNKLKIIVYNSNLGVYEESCIEKCPSNYYLYNNSICLSCSQVSFTDNNWISSCKAQCNEENESAKSINIWNYNTNTCINCPSNSPYLQYNNNQWNCVDSCSVDDDNNTLISDKNNICVVCSNSSSIDFFYNPYTKKCSDTCLSEYRHDSQSSLCDSCSSLSCDHGVCVNGRCLDLIVNNQIAITVNDIIEKINKDEIISSFENIRLLLEIVRVDSDFINDVFKSINNNVVYDSSSLREGLVSIILETEGNYDFYYSSSLKSYDNKDISKLKQYVLNLIINEVVDYFRNNNNDKNSSGRVLEFKYELFYAYEVSKLQAFNNNIKGRVLQALSKNADSTLVLRFVKNINYMKSIVSLLSLISLAFIVMKVIYSISLSIQIKINNNNKEDQI